MREVRLLAAIISLLLAPRTHSQFIQDWTYVIEGNMTTPQWRREETMPLQPVIQTYEPVILEYNCFSMPASCDNVLNWNQSRPFTNVFLLDMNDGLNNGSPRHAPQEKGASSEQVWQDFIHGHLRSKLQELGEQVVGKVDKDRAVVFRLSLANDSKLGPARVLWKDDKGIRQSYNSTPIAELETVEYTTPGDYEFLGLVADELILSRKNQPVMALAQQIKYPYAGESEDPFDDDEVEDLSDGDEEENPSDGKEETSSDGKEEASSKAPMFKRAIPPIQVKKMITLTGDLTVKTTTVSPTLSTSKPSTFQTATSKTATTDGAHDEKEEESSSTSWKTVVDVVTKTVAPSTSWTTVVDVATKTVAPSPSTTILKTDVVTVTKKPTKPKTKAATQSKKAKPTQPKKEKPKSTPRPKNTPDTSHEKPKCYDSGQHSYRRRMIVAIGRFCRELHDKYEVIGPGDKHQRKETFPDWTLWELMPITIVTSVECLDDCEWQVDEATCGRELRKITDRCDTNGEDRKQGGKMQNNCLKWRIDPNVAMIWEKNTVVPYRKPHHNGKPGSKPFRS